MACRFLGFLYLLVCCFTTKAAVINGDVTDAGTRLPIPHVTIVNIYTNESITTDSSGKFSIQVEKGQLLELKKLGYKVLRVRIPSGDIPPYFKLMMQIGPVELPDFNLISKGRDYKKDSMEYAEIYKTYLNFPQLKGYEMIQHPFSALSKRNRQIWAFQKEYTWFEQQKYIDYTFNEKLVQHITGMSGDSAQVYLRVYRPSYEQLRSMNEYTFYSYIKQTVAAFRSRGRERTRSAN